MVRNFALVLFLECLLRGSFVAGYRSCLCPGAPANGYPQYVGIEFPHLTNVLFKCEDGYIMFGSNSRQCIDGKWTDELAECLREVSFKMPNRVTKNDLTSDPSQLQFAVDHDSNTCIKGPLSQEVQEWEVSFFGTLNVRRVVLTFGKSGTDFKLLILPVNGHQEDDCFVGDFKAETGKRYTFECVRNFPAQKLRIRTTNAWNEGFSLCDVEVYSDTVLAPGDTCPDQIKNLKSDQHVAQIDNNCIVVHLDQMRTMAEARKTCESNGGYLPKRADKFFTEFLDWNMRNFTKSLPAGSKYNDSPFKTSGWIGATRDLTDPTWKWSNGQPLKDFEQFSRNSDNDYCVYALNGRLRSSSCSSVHWSVCMYDSHSCGSLAVPENALAEQCTAWKITPNSQIHMYCAEDHFLDRDIENAHCGPDGRMNIKDLKCLGHNCDTHIENGFIYFTGSSSVGIVKCDKGFEPYVSDTKKEAECWNGKWVPTQPSCRKAGSKKRRRHLCFDE